MYRIHLDPQGRQELQWRTHAPNVQPRTRDRLEMVRLSDAGWSIPKIAGHLGLCEKTVRRWLKTFLAEGFDALPDQPHPGQRSALMPEALAALREAVGKGDRTWTAPQMADWLATHQGVRLSANWLRCLLRRAKLRYKRTGRSLKHKQHPEAVAQKTEELRALEKGAMPENSI